jgi:hypothetical protein
MPKCPNCGQPTRRTSDWACQWCGYPLTSKAYKKIDKTYRELKTERPQTEGATPEILPETAGQGQPAPAPAAAPRLELTAGELYTSCTSDKEAAAARFANKRLVVTGTMAKIVIDYDYDIYYVSLHTTPGNQDSFVNCIFDKDGAAILYTLDEGQLATIEGTYDGYELNILLKDCGMISTEEAPKTPAAPVAETEAAAASTAEPAPAPAIEEKEQEQEQEPEPEIAATPETEPQPEPTEEAVPETLSAPEVIPLPGPATEPEPEPKPEPEVAATPETETEPVEPEKEPEPPAVEAAAAPENQEEPTVIPLAAPEPEPEPVVPDIEINITEFLTAYATDATAADARFGGKVIKLTGVISRIELRDYLDQNYVNLSNQADNILEHVRCFFNKKYGPELGQLVVGNSITVQGTYDGSVINMRLKDCILTD